MAGIIFPDRVSRSATMSHDRPAGFWRRQLDDDPTSHQMLFDVVFGAVLPTVCLIVDPVVFRSSVLGFSIAGRYAVFGYLVTITSIALLAVHMRLQRPSALLAGGLAGGAVFSTTLGVVLLPTSVLGLIILIGALGFTPFLSAFVFFRSAKRAWPPKYSGSLAPHSMWLAGLLLVLTPPALAQVGTYAVASVCMDRVLAGRATSSTIAALQILKFTQDLDALVWAYARETDRTKKESLSRDYQRITGRSIDARLARLAD